MSYMAIYNTLIDREPVNYGNLRPGNRIAIFRNESGIEELDVMKIRSIGHSAAAPNDGLIAVALLCPGQSSFRIRSDGSAYLNAVRDPAPQPYAEDARLYFAVIGERKHLDTSQDALLSVKGKKYWVPLARSRIVRVAKQEMKVMQAGMPEPA